MGNGYGQSYKFTVGGTLGLAWRVFAASPGLMSGLVLISLVPSSIVGVLVDEDTPAAMAVSSGAGIATMLGSFLLGMLIQGTVAYAVYRRATGHRVSFGDALRNGFARFPAILGTSLLFSLGMLLACAPFLLGLFLMAALMSAAAVGVILLVIGSIASVVVFFALLFRWYVAVPACAVERAGPRESLRRSAALTKGHFLRMWGIAIVAYIPSLIAEAAAGAIANAVAPDSAAVAVALSVVLTLLPSAYLAVVGAAVYFNLRSAKEGVGIDTMANVFD